jgi:peptidoglycan/LPS O-acetylase OafA/YrhL
MKDRKYFIDNLRWITVFLLFPFHTFIIYNTFGEENYIKGIGNIYLTNINVSFWPWFMPLLFILAGISSKYSLNNRKPKDYLKERFRKLFVPLFFGILIIIPEMAFFADCFHNGYDGNYFQHYKVFFTKWTDLTGYDGGFSPGHLWFILYLFIISIIVLPIIILHNKYCKKINFERINIFTLLSFFIFPLVGQLVLDINGKSIGEYFAWYLIGYFILSNDFVIEKCEKHFVKLTVIAFIGMAFILVIFNKNISVNNMVYDMIEKFYAFDAILALLGISKKHLNISNKATNYFSKISFSVYLFHLFWIVIIAYYVFKVTHEVVIQVFSILIFSIILTFVSNEVLKRFKITKIMFCLK